MNPSRAWAGITALFPIGVIACGSEIPDWCATDGAEVVLNPPAVWSTPPTLERLWRIDGSAEGQELVLPSSIAVSEQLRRIAVVDFQLGDVIIASLDGQWLGRWGKRGSGPGEIGHALAARWADAATLEVYDPAGSKVVRFDTSGAVVGETSIGAPFTAALGGGIAWINFTSDGSLVARPAGLVPVSEGVMEVVVLRTNLLGSSTDTLVSAPVPAIEPEGWMPFVVPDWPVPHAAVSGLGHVAVSGTQQEYRVVVQRPDSNDLVLCRTVAPLPSSDASMDDLTPAIRAALLRAPKPPDPATVGRVSYDEENRLWVQRDLPSLMRAEDNVLGREGALFDVYSGSTYVGEVRLPDRVRFVAALRELIVGLERNDLDEYSLVAYRLVSQHGAAVQRIIVPHSFSGRDSMRLQVAALAMVIASPTGSHAQEPPQEVEPCAVETASADGAWRLIRADGFTFCVPPDWSPVGKPGKDSLAQHRWRSGPSSITWTRGQYVPERVSFSVSRDASSMSRQPQQPDVRRTSERSAAVSRRCGSRTSRAATRPAPCGKVPARSIFWAMHVDAIRRSCISISIARSALPIRTGVSRPVSRWATL